MKNILEGINKEGKKKLEMDIKDIMKLLEQVYYMIDDNKILIFRKQKKKSKERKD